MAFCTLLRRVMRRDRQNELARSAGLVFGEYAYLAPGTIEDGAVQTGFGASSIALKSAFSIGLRLGSASHAPHIQILEGDRFGSWVINQNPADLVCPVLAYVAPVLVCAGDAMPRLAVTSGAFLASIQFLLPTLDLAFPLRQALLFGIGESQGFTVAGVDRNGNTPVDPFDSFYQFLVRKGGEPVANSDGVIGIFVFVAEGKEPTPGLYGERDGSGDFEGPVRLELDSSDQVTLRAKMKIISGDCARSGNNDRFEAEHLSCDPHALTPVLLLEFWPTAESLEEPGVRLPPPHCAVAKNLGRHIPELGRIRPD